MRVQLVVKNAGKQQGMKIPVTVRQFLIGRDETCQLRPASDLISKKHCAILIAPQGVFVEDFKSTNGTRINGQPIQGRVAVKNGDTLAVGTLEFEMQLFAADPSPAAVNPTQAKPTAPTAANVASPTPLPPSSKSVAAMAAKVGAAPGVPTPAAKAEVKPPAPSTPAPAKEPSAMDDDLAALLMDDDDASDTKTRIMETPTVAVEAEPEKPQEAPAGNQPYAGQPPKPIPAMSSSDSAKALLEKMMRRPR